MMLVRPARIALLGVLLAAWASPAQEPPPAEPAPETGSPAPSTLSLGAAAVCRDVQDRTPVDEGTSFPSDVGVLFCFTQVLGAEEPTQVYHRWYAGDRMVLEIPIAVKAATWRCWSRKTIPPSWSGPCRVDIATDAGDVIGTASFTLEPAAAQ
jgi:hypothetical protein